MNPMSPIKTKYLTSWQEKSKGLIGEKKAFPVFFKTRFGIHTFGMKFPIDVVILDQKMCVVLLRKNLEPNRFLFWNPIYCGVLELPSGEAKRIGIEKDSLLKLDLKQ